MKHPFAVKDNMDRDFYIRDREIQKELERRREAAYEKLYEIASPKWIECFGKLFYESYREGSEYADMLAEVAHLTEDDINALGNDTTGIYDYLCDMAYLEAAEEQEFMYG